MWTHQVGWLLRAADPLARCAFRHEVLVRRGSLAIVLARALALLSAVAWTAAIPVAPPSRLALVHATVVDVSGGSPMHDAAVVIEGGRIVAVGPTRTVRIPKGTRIIDASGKFVIPGLWDMHTHLFSNEAHPGTDLSIWAFPLYVANGVTGVRDMWTDPQDIIVARRWNEQRGDGTLLAPRIEWSSQIVDGAPPTWKRSTVVETPDEARRLVRELKAGGAGFIKVYGNLKRDVFLAIADESKQAGIPFAGHIPFAVDAFEASDSGMKSVEHLLGIPETCSPRADELRRTPRTPQLTAMMWDTFDERICASLFLRFAKNGTWQVPTLIVRQAVAGEPTVATNPALRYVPASEREAWLSGGRGSARVDVERGRARFSRLLRIVGDMHRAGVGILAGTDVGNPFMVPGFSLHDELALMVDAGLTPLEALQTATRNVGAYLGRRDVGSVTTGSVADLVVLNGDPTADVHNTRKIAAVILNGRYLDRGTLDRLLR